MRPGDAIREPATSRGRPRRCLVKSSLGPSRRRRLGRLAASLAQTAAPSAGVLVSLLAVRAAGIAVWGEFIAALVLVRLWAQVVNFGSRDHLLRAFSREPGRIGELWRRNLGTRAWMLLPGPVVFLAAGADAGRAAMMTAWLVALVLAQSHDALITYRRAFGFGLAAELGTIGLTVLGVVAAGAALTADGLVAISAVAAIARATAIALRFRVIGRNGIVGRPDLAELRASWPFFALTFSGALQSRVDLYVVAALLPAPAVGTYALLSSFVLLVQSLSSALVAPITPQLYRLEPSRVVVGALRLLAVGVVITLLGIGATWLALRILYEVTVGPVALAAAWLAMLPCFFYLPLVYLAFRAGQERLVVGANLAGTLVAAMGTVLLAPGFGIGGAMAGAAAGQAAVAAAHLLRLATSTGGPAAVPVRPQGGT